MAHTPGVLVELLCETDFVAKNEDFLTLADNIATLVHSTGAADREAVLNLSLGSGETVSEAIEKMAGVIGEKIELGRTAKHTGDTAVYMHRRASDLPPVIGVLVEFDGSAEAAKGIAQQIAAMRPRYLTRDEVPADVVATEKRIAEETAKEEGKPEAALPKIVEGRVNSFFKDNVLLEQASVLDSKKSVKQVLDEAGTTVTSFTRFEIGAE